MSASTRSPQVRTVPLDLETDGVTLPADLLLPDPTRGVVLVAHGSGSSRFSPRNRAVAEELTRAGLGVLLVDLLTEAEGRDRRLVFDIPRLGRRLAALTRTVAGRHLAPGTPVGYFGASTGAAAALWAAAEPDLRTEIRAVVSRGGRPDLAGPRLGSVRAPTLLVVGGADTTVLDLNEQAAHALACPWELVVVPGATHLFAEPGALEQVAAAAVAWFRRYLTPEAR